MGRGPKSEEGLPNCRVRGCPNKKMCGPNNKYNKERGITVHRFPSNPHTSKKWAEFCDDPEFFEGKNLTTEFCAKIIICNWHFDPDELRPPKGPYGYSRNRICGILPRFRPPPPRNMTPEECSKSETIYSNGPPLFVPRKKEGPACCVKIIDEDAIPAPKGVQKILPREDPAAASTSTGGFFLFPRSGQNLPVVTTKTQVQQIISKPSNTALLVSEANNLGTIGQIMPGGQLKLFSAPKTMSQNNSGSFFIQTPAQQPTIMQAAPMQPKLAKEINTIVSGGTSANFPIVEANPSISSTQKTSKELNAILAQSRRFLKVQKGRPISITCPVKAGENIQEIVGKLLPGVRIITAPIASSKPVLKRIQTKTVLKKKTGLVPTKERLAGKQNTLKKETSAIEMESGVPNTNTVMIQKEANADGGAKKDSQTVKNIEDGQATNDDSSLKDRQPNWNITDVRTLSPGKKLASLRAIAPAGTESPEPIVMNKGIVKTYIKGGTNCGLKKRMPLKIAPRPVMEVLAPVSTSAIDLSEEPTQLEIQEQHAPVAPLQTCGESAGPLNNHPQNVMVEDATLQNFITNPTFGQIGGCAETSDALSTVAYVSEKDFLLLLERGGLATDNGPPHKKQRSGRRRKKSSVGVYERGLEIPGLEFCNLTVEQNAFLQKISSGSKYYLFAVSDPVKWSMEKGTFLTVKKSALKNLHQENESAATRRVSYLQVLKENMEKVCELAQLMYHKGALLTMKNLDKFINDHKLNGSQECDGEFVADDESSSDDGCEMETEEPSLDMNSEVQVLEGETVLEPAQIESAKTAPSALPPNRTINGVQMLGATPVGIAGSSGSTVPFISTLPQLPGQPQLAMLPLDTFLAQKTSQPTPAAKPPITLRLTEKLIRDLMEKLPQLVKKKGELHIGKSNMHLVLEELDNMGLRVNHDGKIVKKAMSRKVEVPVIDDAPNLINVIETQMQLKRANKKLDKLQEDLKTARKNVISLKKQLARAKNTKLNTNERKTITMEMIKETFTPQQFAFFKCQFDNSRTKGDNGQRYSQEVYDYCASIFLESRRLYRQLRSTFLLPGEKLLPRFVPNPQYFNVPKRIQKQYRKKKKPKVTKEETDAAVASIGLEPDVPSSKTTGPGMADYYNFEDLIEHLQNEGGTPVHQDEVAVIMNMPHPQPLNP